MTRRERIERYRRRLAAAIAVSIGIHAAVLAFGELAVPASGGPEEVRAPRVVDLSNEWDESAIQVVPLETAWVEETPADAGDRSGISAPDPAAHSALSLPKAVSLPARSNSRPLDVAPITATPAIGIPLPRASRGIIRRSGGGARDAEIRLVAASEAAVRAEDGRDRDGWWAGEGDDGTGISIMIPGMGGGACSGGTIPILPRPSAGLGGVPMSGKGRGIIGARPPSAEAINRFGPRVGGGG